VPNLKNNAKKCQTKFFYSRVPFIPTLTSGILKCQLVQPFQCIGLFSSGDSGEGLIV